MSRRVTYAQMGPGLRTKTALKDYLPAEDERVHRDFVANAFAAGMRAAVTVPITEDEIAREFEAYCQEEFTE